MNASLTPLFDVMASPVGELMLVAHGDALAGVYIAGQKHFPAIGPDWRRDATAAPLRAARTQLAEYFAGARTRFALPLAPRGTAFQRDVWQAVAAVEFGATATYTDVAARAGHAGKLRATGAAIGRNPWLIVVPCHRILGADGGLTGYAGGLDRKRALLALERDGAAQAAGARRAA